MSLTVRNAGKHSLLETRALRSLSIAGAALLSMGGPVAAAAQSQAAAAQQQSGIPAWVWLVLAVIVLAILIFAMMRRRKAEPNITTTRSARGDSATPSRSAATDPTISTRGDR